MCADTIVQGLRGFQYYIKWLGYEKESDNTWEDEENCAGSEKLIESYWAVHGPKPLVTTPQKGAARKRNLSTPASEGGTTKKLRKESAEEKTPLQSKVAEISTWKPPADLQSWDASVAHIETIEKTDNGLLLVYLQW